MVVGGGGGKECGGKVKGCYFSGYSLYDVVIFVFYFQEKKWEKTRQFHLLKRKKFLY